MQIKQIKLLLVGLLFAPFLNAHSVSTAEASAIRGLTDTIRQYRTYIEDVPVTSWDQIAKLDVNLYGTKAGFKDEDPTELYSFISVDQRAKFPEGELLLIRYEPLPFPDLYKEHHRRQEETEADLENPNYKPIRYLLYRNSRGEIESRWWYEDRVQEMLRETEIEIPKPIKFTNYIDPRTHVGIKLNEEIKEPLPPVAEAIEEVAAPEPTIEEEPAEVVVAEPIEEDAEQSSNWWLWLIGAVVVVGGVFVVRSRK